MKFNYKHYYPFIKWILILCSIWFFIHQWQSSDQENWKSLLKHAKDHGLTLGVVLLLMLVNWYIESVKFRILLKNSLRLTAIKSWLIVFAGTTISNFTPARTGDYIGRSLMLKKVPAVKVVLATVTGNLLQVLMTYALGLLAFVYLMLFSSRSAMLSEYRKWLLLAGILMLVILLLFVSFPKMLKNWRNRIPQGIRSGFQMVSSYNKRVIVKVGGLSLLRYITFSMQFFLLLQVFAADPLAWSKVLYIPAAFLLQSLVPVPAISDIGFRVYFSGLLFAGLMSTSEITLAVTSLWLINLILPALIGAVYLLYSLFAKE